MYAIDPRSDVRYYQQGVWVTDEEMGQARLFPPERERSEREAVRFAARELGESEPWVRAFSEGPHWHDKSHVVPSGRFFTCTLYVDRGGLDPAPICHAL
jgi:hypothetical protein